MLWQTAGVSGIIMTKTPRMTRPTKAVAVLAAGLMLTAVPGWAGGKRPARNFLPPVSVINGPVESRVPQVVEPVSLSAVETRGVSLNSRIKKLATDLDIREENQAMKSFLALQQDLAEEDLNALWTAAVERNPVVRFSLEKIHTPTDLQNQKSSVFLNKVLSALVQGATLGATMMPGGGYYQNMTALAGGQAAQNLVDKYTMPKTSNLTATEQIQLAGLLEDLRARLIKSYHSYKQTLAQLDVAHRAAIEANNLYSKAMAANDPFAEMVAASTYYEAVRQETELRHEAKIHRLHLERLAGKETVDDLKLALMVDEPLKGKPSEMAVKTDPAVLVGPPEPELPAELSQPLEQTPELNNIVGPPLPRNGENPALMLMKAAEESAEKPSAADSDASTVGPEVMHDEIR